MITLNDILITLRHSLDNQFDGFEASFNACKNTEEKKAFLQKCMKIINCENARDFEKLCPSPESTTQTSTSTPTMDLDNLDTPDDFFTNQLSVFFTNPARVFPNLSNFTAQDKSIVVLFTKLVLLKLVYETYKKNSELLDADICSQIGEANRKLYKEYTKLKRSEPVRFNNKVINNLDELADAMNEVAQRENWVIDILSRNLIRLPILILPIYSLIMNDSSRKEEDRFFIGFSF